MHPPSLAFDGLRRCLCPGVSRASWLAVMRGTRAQRPVPSLEKRPLRGAGRSTTLRQIRAYSALPSAGLEAGREDPVSRPSAAHSSASNPDQSEESAMPNDTSTEVMRLLGPIHPHPSKIEDFATESFIEAILTLRQPEQAISWGVPLDQVYNRIILLTDFLVTQRGMRTSPFIYESLMDAMADPKGSSHGAFGLLRDMEKARLKLTETICRSALRVLTIHPHYSLQVFILGVMRENWYTFEPTDVQNVVLGLLRDEQDDLAYRRFMEMIQTGVEPELWVYDVLAMTFGSKRLYDEMLEIFRLRSQRETEVDGYVNLIYHMLDCCSSGFHYPGTAAAWDAGVAKGLFDPSDGILDNVLATAAIQGDRELAVAAYEMLSSRTRMNSEQYAALFEAFCNSQDISGAIGVLSIAEGAGVYSGAMQGMTEFLVAHLSKEDCDETFDTATKTVKDLAAEKKPVAQALNALIRAIARKRGGERAAQLFRDMPTICGQEPDDKLLRTMIKYTREDDLLCRQFAQQYRETIPEQSQVPDNWRTYSNLIKRCLSIEALDLAMRFALELTHSVSISRRTSTTWFAELLRQASAAKDERIWQIYDKIKRTRGWGKHTRDYLETTMIEFEQQTPWRLSRLREDLHDEARQEKQGNLPEVHGQSQDFTDGPSSAVEGSEEEDDVMEGEYGNEVDTYEEDKP